MNYLKTFLPHLFGNKKGKSLDTLLPDPVPWSDLNFEETLMFHTLKNNLNQFVLTLDFKSLSQKDIFHLLNFFEFLNHELQNKINTEFKDEQTQFLEATNANLLSAKEVQELLDYKNDKLSVFVFLNPNRKRPGTLVIRAPNGQFFKNQDHIWSIPILGLSGRGLSFNHSNGCTPTGVFSLDSVMPLADKTDIFGKHRRLIVNFIKPSDGEHELKKFLPKNHHSLHWWKPSVIGRELGRSLLRIHGTGRQNRNPITPYYPFFPTSGCLATNESEMFGLKKSQDQRLLLDALMEVSNLPKTFENESKIQGLLYVVELDANLTTLRFY